LEIKKNTTHRDRRSAFGLDDDGLLSPAALDVCALVMSIETLSISDDSSEFRIGNDMVDAQRQSKHQFHQMAVRVVREPSARKPDFPVFERCSKFSERFDVLVERTFGGGPSKPELRQYPYGSAVAEADLRQGARQCR
jgi:hypothetical protein